MRRTISVSIQFNVIVEDAVSEHAATTAVDEKVHDMLDDWSPTIDALDLCVMCAQVEK